MWPFLWHHPSNIFHIQSYRDLVEETRVLCVVEITCRESPTADKFSCSGPQAYSAMCSGCGWKSVTPPCDSRSMRSGSFQGWARSNRYVLIRTWWPMRDGRKCFRERNTADISRKLCETAGGPHSSGPSQTGPREFCPNRQACIHSDQLPWQDGAHDQHCPCAMTKGIQPAWGHPKPGIPSCGGHRDGPWEWQMPSARVIEDTIWIEQICLKKSQKDYALCWRWHFPHL